MGFQFTDIDDVVSLHNGCNDVEGVIGKTIRTVDSFCGKIHIQRNLRFQLLHATDMIQIFHMFRIVESARAFGKDDICHSVFSEPACNAFHHKGMSGNREIRAFRHDHIGFYHNLEICLQFLFNAKSLHGFADGRVDQFFFIFGDEL